MLADVYVVDIDGNDQPRLVGTGVGDWGGLLWSPDGTLVATFNLASDHLVVMALDPAVLPVQLASPHNVALAQLGRRGNGRAAWRRSMTLAVADRELASEPGRTIERGPGRPMAR